MLRQRNLTLAVSDWATDGLLVEWLIKADIKSDIYLAGQTTDAGQATEPYGPTAAIKSAEHVRSQTSADIGLSIAAFPPETDEPDGYVFAALAMPKETRKLRFPCLAHPSIVRSRTAKQALNALRLALL